MLLPQAMVLWRLDLAGKNNDPEDWSNKYYNAMTYGVGFYSGYIGDPAVLGNPNALYGFLDMPFGNYYGDKRTTWHFSPAFGLTYNLVPYDETNNPTNDAIGAKFAVYINFAFSGHTAMTRDMDFYLRSRTTLILAMVDRSPLIMG